MIIFKKTSVRNLIFAFFDVTPESGSEAGLLHGEKAILGEKKKRFFPEGPYEKKTRSKNFRSTKFSDANFPDAPTFFVFNKTF